MKHPCSHASFGLTRRSSGLSPAHVALIKLLAEVAVANYLREINASSDCTTEVHQPMRPVPT
jgi:hypothetical protein